MTRPWLSVLIPTYNGETYLPYTLESIMDQGDENIECIVVDDGSTDSTASILTSYQSKDKLKVLQRERRGNWVANTNYALSFAQGEYICFLHQDDLWFQNRLSSMKILIEQYPDVGFLLHSSFFLDHAGNKLGQWRCPLPPFPQIISPTDMMERLLVQNFISIPAPMFKREVALKVGGLEETLWYTADWDFWLKIAACSETLYYPHSLSGFRIQPTSQTVLRSSYIEDFKNQLEKVVQNNLPLWSAPDSIKDKILKTAEFSVRVNTALASMFHGHRTDLTSLFFTFLFLGPSGWFRYLRDSRIWERSFARLRARLIARHH